jgi:cold shock protein
MRFASAERAEVVNTGTIVRFDGTQGYGFITPDSGGEDVFLHASVLDDSVKGLVRGGMRVEFEAAKSERGLKALQVHVLDDIEDASAVSYPTAKSSAGSAAREDDELCDVLPSAEFSQKITDVLIDVAPSVTGSQIVQVRQRLVAFAKRHGWVDG